MNVTTTHFATLLFSRLLASSPRCKTVARSIKPSPALAPSTPNQDQFFVPADDAQPALSVQEQDDDDLPQSLIPLFSENLSLSFLSKSRVDTADEELVREWERLIVGYLTLLGQWLWEDPKAVREFLEAGGLGVVSVDTHLCVCLSNSPSSLSNRSIKQRRRRVCFLVCARFCSVYAMNSIANLEKSRGGFPPLWHDAIMLTSM